MGGWTYEKLPCKGGPSTIQWLATSFYFIIIGYNLVDEVEVVKLVVVCPCAVVVVEADVVVVPCLSPQLLALGLFDAP